MRVGPEWVLCHSDIPEERLAVRCAKVDLELGQWCDLAVVFQPGKAISLYRDGQFVKALPLEADLTPVMARGLLGHITGARGCGYLPMGNF